MESEVRVSDAMLTALHEQAVRFGNRAYASALGELIERRKGSLSRSEVLRCVDDESELEGPPPLWAWFEIHFRPVRFIRQTVAVTKASIKLRIMERWKEAQA